MTINMKFIRGSLYSYQRQLSRDNEREKERERGREREKERGLERPSL